LASFYILHQQKDMILVAKVSVELDDVRMIEHIEDFELKAELGLHSVLTNC
jgi:hypothetical protein